MSFLLGKEVYTVFANTKFPVKSVPIVRRRLSTLYSIVIIQEMQGRMLYLHILVKEMFDRQLQTLMQILFYAHCAGKRAELRNYI